MTSPLVATKLHVPRPRRDLVRRERLYQLLERGAESRLTLVSAPAGFGKTTLLVDWLANRKGSGRAVAWVSLERTDNEISAFWRHLLAAVGGAAAELGEDFPLHLLPEQRPDHGLTAALLNALAELTGEIEMVLDDFHLIEDKAIVEEFAFFLDHLPANVRLLVGTRADPALPLARLRARGELAEIRSADLRFRPEEIANYFQNTMQLRLAAGDMERLSERTEGWIAALQLAALSIRDRSDVSQFVANFAGSDRYIVDYLVEEVLRSQPEEVRRFFFSTCVLGRFCAELCDAVVGGHGSAAMIDALDAQNLFIVALDDRRQWYRYHHLFADVLAAHMPDAERQRLPELQLRASVWLEQHGEDDEAIRHALAAPDFERAADLIERATPEWARARRETHLRTVIAALPDALVRSRPALSLSLAGPLVQAGEIQGLAERLDEAERQLRAVGVEALAPHIGAIELYRSALAQMRGDLGAATEHALRVFDLAPKDANLERAGAAGFLAIVAWSSGDLETAQKRWTDCSAGLLQVGYISDILGLTYARGRIAVAQGRLGDAERMLEQGLSQAAAQKGYPPLGSADLATGLAELGIERNDLDAAHEHLARGETGDLTGLPQYPARSLVAMARLEQAEGRIEDALALLDEATRVYVGDFFPNVRPIAAMRARMQIEQRDWPAVERWLRESGLGPDSDLAYVREYELITLARYLLAKEDLPATLLLTDRLLGSAESGGRNAAVIELLVLRSLALEARGDSAGALTALRRALGLAEPEGQARVFLDEGDRLAALLRAATKGRAASAHARKLLVAFGAPQAPRPVEHPDLLEPLSERELDVLKLLRGDLNGPDIAGELRVSLNTVRTHTKNIYEKLGVNSRRAAVRRAEEMNLLRRDKPA
ncbi:MAG: LuxR C-terminal-related transcriptional regulator [Devosia sp.]